MDVAKFFQKWRNDISNVNSLRNLDKPNEWSSFLNKMQGIYKFRVLDILQFFKVELCLVYRKKKQIQTRSSPNDYIDRKQ